MDTDVPISLFDRNTLKPRNPKEQQHNTSISFTSAPVKAQPVNTNTIVTNSNITVNGEAKNNTNSFANLKISENEVNFIAQPKPKPQLQPQQQTTVQHQIDGKVTEVKVDSTRIDSNTTWKTGLNKQGNIDLAFISQEGAHKAKGPKNIMDMVGNVGSIEVNEKSERKEINEVPEEAKPKVMSIPEDIFSSEIKDESTDVRSNRKLLDGLSSSGQVGSVEDVSSKFKKEEEVRKVVVSESNSTRVPTQSNAGFVESQNVIGQAKFGTKFNEEDDNIDFNNRLDFTGVSAKVDTKNDISGLQNWKNPEKREVDVGLPDLTGVKSKINTGLNQIKTVDKEFQKENDELKKRFEELQKEKDFKIKEYREMLLKIKKDKNKEDLKKEVSSALIKT